MLPFPEGVKGYADGDSLRQLFSSSGLTFAYARGIVRYILSETGVGPVPILPVVSHMFPPAFSSFELGNRKKAVFEGELAKVPKFPIQTAPKHIKG